MSAPSLYAVTFVNSTKYRLIVAADSVEHAIDLAQLQLESGDIWRNAEPYDGTQDDWCARVVSGTTEQGGAPCAPLPLLPRARRGARRARV